MRMVDVRCTECGHVIQDLLLRSGMKPLPFTCPKCRTPTLDLVHLQAHSVHGDEIDIEIKNGLCNADGSPKRYRSKTDLFRDAKARGMVNWVEHKGTKGGDRSKLTQRFI